MVEHRVRIAVFNTWRESDGITLDLNKVGPNCDVMLLMEAANHETTIRAWCQSRFDWDFLIPDHESHNARQNVILFRPSVFICPESPVRVEQMCEATNGTPPRFMTAKRLCHRDSGRGIRFRVTHLNSHVERQSWWRLARFTQFRRHIKKLRAAMVKGRFSSCVELVGMDTNVSYKAAHRVPLLPYASLRRKKVISNYQELGLPEHGTKGVRFIDALFGVRRPFWRFLGQRVITGLHSDHNALIVTIGII